MFANLFYQLGKFLNGNNETDYEIDYDSLKAIGLGGRTASFIKQQLEAGYIVQKVVNGKLTYYLNEKHPAYKANKTNATTTTKTTTSNKNAGVNNWLGRGKTGKR